MAVLIKIFPDELEVSVRRIWDGSGVVGEIGCDRVRGGVGNFGVADETEVRSRDANDASGMQTSLLVVSSP